MALPATVYWEGTSQPQLTTSPAWVTNRRSRADRLDTSQLVRWMNRGSFDWRTSCWVSGIVARENLVSVGGGVVPVATA